MKTYNSCHICFVSPRKIPEIAFGPIGCGSKFTNLIFIIKAYRIYHKLLNLENENDGDTDGLLENFRESLSNLAILKFKECVYDDSRIAAFFTPNLRRFKFVSENIREQEIELAKNLVRAKLSTMPETPDEPTQPQKKRKKTDNDYEVDSDEEGVEGDEVDAYFSSKITQLYGNSLEFWSFGKIRTTLD